MTQPVKSAFAFLVLLAACTSGSAGERDTTLDASRTSASSDTLPASGDDAMSRLTSSPRHAEWSMIPTGSDSVQAWVVYPERPDNAPVVLVVHEIFGLSPWIRAVADQLAADGFIAIAPDLLTGMDIPGAPENPDPDAARAAIRNLESADVQSKLLEVARWGMALPAATDRYGIVGFCWGGTVSFVHATTSPELGASVVYYGSSPETSTLSSIRAPVLGLYGGSDQRVNATIPAADSAMRSLGKVYETEIYEGAAHGFLRQQGGQDGANLEAARQAWPRTVSWFRQHLEG